MYLDFSLKKIASLSGFVLALCCLLFATTLVKQERYGSTPPFYSIDLFSREISLYSWYSIRNALERTYGSAGVAEAFVFGNSDYLRDKGARSARAIPILTYHRIVDDENDLNNVTSKNFSDQMFALKRAGWHTITLADYKQFMAETKTLPEKSVLITFDDGAKESFYPVDPIFAALGFHGVNFIIANASRTKNSTYYLSETEIKRMLRTGRFEIGSHSFDGHHPYSTDATGGTGIFFADKLWLSPKNRLETTAEFKERIRNDLILAKETLQKTYGVSITTFAFPLGNETGINGAANFPEGSAVTEKTAAEIYTTGFLQTNNHRYSFNYPNNDFLSYRIHVYHDWDGTRLLNELEQGLPKDLPFSDNFERNRGWIPAWGSLDLGRNNLVLKPDSGASGASAFLDGTRDWNNYVFDTSLTWNDGFVLLLADVIDSKTYHACAFGDGLVRIQEVTNGNARTLAEFSRNDITYGKDVRMGIRVHDSVIECTWNYESVVEAYERSYSGGIGIQTWNPATSSSTLQVSEILVRPYNATTTTGAHLGP